MKIAIVNDMLLALEGLRRALHHSHHQIIWMAQNGEVAVERCRIDRPDLILMDLFMPCMGGVEATRLIMAQSPCAVLIVTSSVDDHAASAFEAMGAGALDAVNTPVCGGGMEVTGAEDLLNKIATIERLIRYDAPPQSLPAPRKTKLIAQNAVPLVVIGASSGGPQVLATILAALPPDFAAAVVIVQHVDALFAGELADWLNQQSPLEVMPAQHGVEPRAGHVLVAQTDDHLVMNEAGELVYTPEPRDMVYRPSVDIFFESVVAHAAGPVLALLLTGMGRDGAQGLLQLKRRGCCTVVQSRESCAVYGMPKAAIESEAAVKILPPERMAAEICRWQAENVQLIEVLTG